LGRYAGEALLGVMGCLHAANASAYGSLQAVVARRDAYGVRVRMGGHVLA